MPVKIEVAYPKADGSPFAEEDIAALQTFEAIITERAVALLNSTSNYRWEQDPTATSNVYARLVKRSGDVEIMSQPMAFFRTCPVDKFEELFMESAFTIARREDTPEPSA